MERLSHRRRAAPLALLAAALAALLLIPFRPAGGIAPALRAGVRDLQRAQLAWTLRAWPRLHQGGLTVYYAPGLGSQADIVVAAARLALPQVLRDFALPADTPAVLVVADAAQIQRHTGAVDVLGAYAGGVIWLLPPSAFLRAGAGLAAAYDATGPVVHELTHLADNLTAGRLPPIWLDEGLAAYEDWRLTGYVWVQAHSGFGGPTYNWQQLSGPGFYHLPDQALAFRQALAAVAAICGSGPGACDRLLGDMRSGMSTDGALQAVLGRAGFAALQAGADWRPGRAPVAGAPPPPAP